MRLVFLKPTGISTMYLATALESIFTSPRVNGMPPATGPHFPAHICTSFRVREVDTVRRLPGGRFLLESDLTRRFSHSRPSSTALSTLSTLSIQTPLVL